MTGAGTLSVSLMAAPCVPRHALDSRSWQPASHLVTVKGPEIRKQISPYTPTTSISRYPLGSLLAATYSRTCSVLLVEHMHPSAHQ